jgi:hypothetical protein
MIMGSDTMKELEVLYITVMEARRGERESD